MKPETEKEQQIFRSIADKILPKIYIPQLENIFNIRFNNQQIIQSLTEDTVTNILIPEALTRPKKKDSLIQLAIQYKRKIEHILRRARDFRVDSS